MRPMTIFFGGNKQLLCRPLVTFGPNVGARGVCWIHTSFTKKRYGVTWQVPTPLLLYGNEQLRYELLVVLRPSSGFFVGVWYA